MSRIKFRTPMSAKNYESCEKRVEFPCAAQPKFDGVRCVTDGRRFWSRNGKLFPAKNVAHLRTELAFPFLIDGELMIPGRPFEETISAVKHASDEDRSASRRLRFLVFDVLTKSDYRIRFHQVDDVVHDAKQRGARWNRVLTVWPNDRDELKSFARSMLKKGHEGTMIRNLNGLYESKRSFNLLKWKPLLDAEYEIIAVKEAKGKDKGTPIFVCFVPGSKKYPSPQRFNVRPMGTMKQRRKMWKNRDQLIGLSLTVEYQNLTKYGVPRFPRAKVFRDYE